jgi:hypothetical protein
MPIPTKSIYTKRKNRCVNVPPHRRELHRIVYDEPRSHRGRVALYVLREDVLCWGMVAWYTDPHADHGKYFRGVSRLSD